MQNFGNQSKKIHLLNESQTSGLGNNAEDYVEKLLRSRRTESLL